MQPSLLWFIDLTHLWAHNLNVFALTNQLFSFTFACKSWNKSGKTLWKLWWPFANNDSWEGGGGGLVHSWSTDQMYHSLYRIWICTQICICICICVLYYEMNQVDCSTAPLPPGKEGLVLDWPYPGTLSIQHNIMHSGLFFVFKFACVFVLKFVIFVY